MPIYDFKCRACENTFESFKRISTREEPLSEACPSCGQLGYIELLLSAPAIIDPRKLGGRLPVNTKLQEKLQQIHAGTHGSRLDTASTITKI
jgi:putative FmdB family regulatory protein